MRAQILMECGAVEVGRSFLTLREVPTPVPGPGELLLRVAACGVCHTELDEIEGRTPPPQLPVIPGHQVIGYVVSVGSGVTGIETGERRGVAWIFSACGSCRQCRSGNENLCPEFRATGRDCNGGYAEFMISPVSFTYPIPQVFADAQAAPLLCAGAIGYRSLSLSGLRNGEVLGLAGFGASAHLVLALSRFLHPDSPVVVFARSEEERAFARELGASWCGDFGQRPPELPAAIIDTTPVWRPVLESLSILPPGGRLVINAIRKEEHDRHLLAGLDYATQLWMEKQITSVANVTREDVRSFLTLAEKIPILPQITCYPLEDAMTALLDVKQRRNRGANVIVMS